MRFARLACLCVALLGCDRQAASVGYGIAVAATQILAARLADRHPDLAHIAWATGADMQALWAVVEAQCEQAHPDATAFGRWCSRSLPR